VIATVVLSVAMIGTAVLGARHPTSTPLALSAVMLNVLILAIIARVFTPFLIAPGTAGLAVLIMIAGPTFRRPVVVVSMAIGFSLAILLPWLAELTGLLQPTTLFHIDHVALQPVELSADPLRVQIALVSYAPLLVTLSTLSALVFARNEDRARRQLQLQAWRLKQLVT
jgi:hypothetical protein